MLGIPLLMLHTRCYSRGMDLNKDNEGYSLAQECATFSYMSAALKLSIVFTAAKIFLLLVYWKKSVFESQVLMRRFNLGKQWQRPIFTLTNMFTAAHFLLLYKINKRNDKNAGSITLKCVVTVVNVVNVIWPQQYSKLMAALVLDICREVWEIWRLTRDL